jgi:hypothetical protein
MASVSKFALEIEIRYCCDNILDILDKEILGLVWYELFCLEFTNMLFAY